MEFVVHINSTLVALAPTSSWFSTRLSVTVSVVAAVFTIIVLGGKPVGEAFGYMRPLPGSGPTPVAPFNATCGSTRGWSGPTSREVKRLADEVLGPRRQASAGLDNKRHQVPDVVVLRAAGQITSTTHCVPLCTTLTVVARSPHWRFQSRLDARSLSSCITTCAAYQGLAESGARKRHV